MSFGSFASAWYTWSDSGSGDILQQNSGIWTGTTMAVSLPGPTAPASTIALFVAGNTLVSTPAGWALRESQVQFMGHYLFTRTGGTNLWSIPTNNGVGTYYIAEIGGSAYDASVSSNDSGGDASYVTPSVVPTAGARLLLASIGSVADEPYAVRTVSGWTNGFSEAADVCNPTADYPMQGVAARTLAADGVSGYATGATYSINSSGRSAIIAAFTTS